jgi:hypothetical protein
VPYYALTVLARFVAAPILLILLAACGAGESQEASQSASADGSGASVASQAPASDSDGEMVSAFDLEVGECFDGPDSGTVEEVERIDCASPHTYEIYAAIVHPGGNNEPFPGDDAIGTFAEDECIAAFEPFVGLDYDSSELFIFYLQPTAETWQIGDREVLCTVYLENDTLVGTVEGSGR